MNTNQLEIGLKLRPCLNSSLRRQRRVSRARWWFAQMRRAVNQAQPWQPPSEAVGQELAPVPDGTARKDGTFAFVARWQQVRV